MSKTKTVYVCKECGREERKWVGVCAKCREYNTYEEKTIIATPTAGTKTGERLATATTGNKPTKVKNISTSETQKRLKTNIAEFDRVLGGGFISGGVALLAGQPGAGKSSILAAVAQGVAEQNKKVLYVSGEESDIQIASRKRRVGATAEEIYILSETNSDNIQQAIYDLRPELVIIDSIQTLLTSRSESKAGSPSQVVEVASLFTSLAKSLNIPTVLVGHVTKNDQIGGPRQVEHLVDTVLYLEASGDTPLRMLRAIKNRYGATDEVGVFQHAEDGLKEIKDPSEFFTNPHGDGVSGYATAIIVEGLRAIPIEVQALVSKSNLPNPRKITHGLEHSRSLMLQAVVEKYSNMQLADKDVYVTTTAGVKITDPGIDLAVIAALFSSLTNTPPPKMSAFMGEMSLTGETRRAKFLERRKKEADSLGFTDQYTDANARTVGDIQKLFVALTAKRYQ